MSLDESASKSIREEVRSVYLPQLQKLGRDPSSKDVYPEICKVLAKKHKVDYNTAKRAWDRVLKDQGAAQPTPAKATQATQGGAKITVQPQPKSTQQGQPSAEQAQEGKKPTPQMEKELATKLFASMHKTTAEMIFGLVEAAWEVKIERPDSGMRIDDPSNPYYSAGAAWAEVVEAYGVALPKVLVLLGAGAMTAQVIALPIAKANAEVKKREKKKKEDEERQKNQQPASVVDRSAEHL